MALPNIWVWRHDGTLQCNLGAEETLQEARDQLETIIGAANVSDGKKRTLPGAIIAMCGAPTGKVNAFEVTPFGFWLLYHGFVGPIGFRPWMDENLTQDDGGGGGLKFASNVLTQTGRANAALVGVAKGEPSSIDELYGRKCRVYTVGDGLTDDYLPERFNIGLVGDRIKEMWFG